MAEIVPAHPDWRILEPAPLYEPLHLSAWVDLDRIGAGCLVAFLAAPALTVNLTARAFA